METCICKEEKWRISHKDGKESLQKRQKKQPKRQEKKNRTFLQYPGKSVFRKRGLYGGMHIEHEGYKTFVCSGANSMRKKRESEYMPLSFVIIAVL